MLFIHKVQRSLLFAAVLFWLPIGKTHAFSLQLFGDALISQPSTATSSAFFRTSMQFGFGGSIGFWLGSSRSFELEFGGVYTTRAFKFDLGATEVTLSHATLFTPVTLKYWLFSFLNLGVGGYLSTGLGKVNALIGERSIESDFSTLGLSGMDFGVLGGAGLKIPIKWVVLFFDYKYCYGLKSNLAGSSLYYTDHHFFLGLRFFAGGGGGGGDPRAGNIGPIPVY